MRSTSPAKEVFETHHFTCMNESHPAGWRSDVPSPFPPSSSLIIRHPPQSLYIRGRATAFELLSFLPEFGLAIVGTRRPQPRSLHFVRSSVQALRGSNLIILSGLALGIDTAAHTAALDAQLPTIAILGGSLDEIYPEPNRELALRILREGGLLVSEFAPGTKIERHFFLLRNRLIAGWSKATWIAEASHRSGALNTANWAWDHDRDTYATPCFPGDPVYAGAQGLLNRDKAYAFWDASSLRHTWEDLASVAHPRRIHPLPSLWPNRQYPYNDKTAVSDAQSLKIEVTRATLQRGGASVDFLLDWALAREWNPQRFFEALQVCLSERQIHDYGGVLCSRRARGRRPDTPPTRNA